MPNIKSAKKRMELSRVANTRNRANRSKIKTAIRRVREAEDKETAETQLRQAVAILDRAATRNLLPKNRVARRTGCSRSSRRTPSGPRSTLASGSKSVTSAAGSGRP
jgi:small subunit ribosomal protein S20